MTDQRPNPLGLPLEPEQMPTPDAIEMPGVDVPGPDPSGPIDSPDESGIDGFDLPRETTAELGGTLDQPYR